MAKTEEQIETMIAAKEDFDREIMPKAREVIKKYIAEYDKEFINQCRTEYLKEKMSKAIINCWLWIAMYEEDCRKDLPAMNRLYSAQKINQYAHEISGLQGAIIAMKKPERPGQITDDMIERAREYSMLDILEGVGCRVRLNRCACPVHGGKNPSSFSVKNNRGICHCGWHGDSIELYRELHKVDFVTAVKELQ